MEWINSSKELHEAIFVLEQKKERQRKELESELEQFHKSLSPSVIVKNAFRNFVGENNITTTAASSALGFGSGLIAKKLVTGKSGNIFKKLLGGLVQIAVTGLVTKSSGKAAAKSIKIGKKVFS
jgi:tetrahydromethanopterin S-methyltransferase subunit B